MNGKFNTWSKYITHFCQNIRFTLFYGKIGDTVPEFNCLMINSICRFISGWSSLIKHRRISSIPYIKVTKKDNLYFNI